MNQGMFGLILVEPKRHVGTSFLHRAKRSEKFYVFQHDMWLGEHDMHMPTAGTSRAPT